MVFLVSKKHHFCKVLDVKIENLSKEQYQENIRHPKFKIETFKKKLKRN